MWATIGGWMSGIGSWFSRATTPQVADFQALAALAKQQLQSLLEEVAVERAERKAILQRMGANEAEVASVKQKLKRCRRMDRRKSREIRALREQVAVLESQHAADLVKIGRLESQNADQQRQIDEMKRTMGVPTGAATP